VVSSVNVFVPEGDIGYRETISVQEMSS